MSIIGRRKKQPGETIDYDVSYVRFFHKRTDDISTASVSADTGITVGTNTVLGKVYKIFLSGGTPDVTYKVTTTMTTTTGVIKEDEFYVTIKEI